MVAIVPPFAGGPQIPPTVTGQSYPQSPPPPPWAYGLPPPRETADPLVTIGAVLTVVGGLVIGFGWFLPMAGWEVVVSLGWLMFGPGIGIALMGLERRRR